MLEKYKKYSLEITVGRETQTANFVNKKLGVSMTHEKFKECCKRKIKMIRKSIPTVSSRP